MDDVALTRGTLLDGRVSYSQPCDGYRTGLEPVFLAAFVPARSGQHVIEAGTGAGAALLCLAARVSGVVGLGIERDAGLARLATMNAAANGFDRLSFRASAIEHLTTAETGIYDHAMANPPWHDPAGTASCNGRRDAAKRADSETLPVWISALARCLKHRGTLSLIIAAANLDAALGVGGSFGMGSVRIMPLWPKAGRDARLVLLQSIRGGHAPTRLLPGLVLHTSADTYTDDAQAVLRHGAACT